MPKISDEHLALIRLDKNRDHGRVFPPENGAHFEQDGMYFDVNGQLAAEYVDANLMTRLERLRIRRVADQEAEKARREALARLGVDMDAPEFAGLTTDQAEDIAVKEGKGDDPKGGIGQNELVAWAKGQKLYSLQTLRKAAEEVWSREVTSKKDLLDFMLDNDFVAPEDAKAKVDK